MYDRSRYAASAAQYQQPPPPPQQQSQYAGTSDHLMPPGPGPRGHTPNSASGGGANIGAPLLLNNLAQHLNNPPAPAGPHSMGGGYPGAPQNQPGGKLLLMPGGAQPPAGSEEEKIYILITELLDASTREAALLELSKKREMYEDLALVLWGGFGKLAVPAYLSSEWLELMAQVSCRHCCSRS